MFICLVRHDMVPSIRCVSTERLTDEGVFLESNRTFQCLSIII